MSLVAGQSQRTLLELIGVGVDVGTILKEQLGHAYKGCGLKAGGKREILPSQVHVLLHRHYIMPLRHIHVSTKLKSLKLVHSVCNLYCMYSANVL